MTETISFLKRNAVLVGAWILAIVSMFMVPPNKSYIDYIDWKTLGLLWSLMVIMIVFQKQGVFEQIGQKLLRRTKNAGQLSAVLILLCFFMGMFITNDVALLTFVPFAIMLLTACDREDLLIPVIVLQTVAANLGSMLLQVGNPQNLYLYGISHMDAVDFVQIMFPYSAVSLGLIIICFVMIKDHKMPVASASALQEIATGDDSSWEWKLAYLCLFVLCLTSVARLIPWFVPVFAVLVITGLYSWRSLLAADYSLLMTFMGFFIFTGNMTHVRMVSNLLEAVVAGKEVVVAIIASQFISNVPAALLLSNFTDNIEGLIIGTNLGGLGTIIASMASLISFKLYAGTRDPHMRQYLFIFTVVNVIFLIALLALYVVTGL